MALHKIDKHANMTITGFCREHGEPKYNGACDVCRFKAMLDITRGTAIPLFQGEK